jgi:hypothetical protein
MLESIAVSNGNITETLEFRRSQFAALTLTGIAQTEARTVGQRSTRNQKATIMKIKSSLNEVAEMNRGDAQLPAASSRETQSAALRFKRKNILVEVDFFGLLTPGAVLLNFVCPARPCGQRFSERHSRQLLCDQPGLRDLSSSRAGRQVK